MFPCILVLGTMIYLVMVGPKMTVKKDKRMRIDNNLDSLSSNDTKKSLSSDEDPSDFDDMESDIGDGIEDPIDNSSSSLI